MYHLLHLIPCANADVTIADIGSIANMAIGRKRHPSKRVDSARALLHMFLELLAVRHGDNPSTTGFNYPQPSSFQSSGESNGIIRAIDLFNKYSGSTVVTLDPSAYAMAAVLHCMRTIALSLSNDILVVLFHDYDHGPSHGQSVSRQRDVASTAFLPTMGDIARNPLLLVSTLSHLRTYDRNFTM